MYLKDKTKQKDLPLYCLSNLPYLLHSHTLDKCLFAFITHPLIGQGSVVFSGIPQTLIPILVTLGSQLIPQSLTFRHL